MGLYKEILRILVTLVYCYIVIKVVFPIVNAIPVDYANGEDYQDPADDRMVKPPRFPYDGPYGFYSSGILCIFDQTPYIGGWFGRSCAGPIAPFMQPTPPSTEATTTTTTTPAPPTTQPVNLMQQQMQWWQMMMQGNGWGSPYQSYFTQAAETDPYEDYGDPVEGDPWVPDDDTVFIETYGQSASKPGFKLGDPSEHK